MINSIEVKKQILDQLKTLPYCKPNSSMKNWTVRCPYCGDSQKSNHGHFSILIDLESDAPLLYRCFRCNESGILNPQVLEDLSLGYDEHLNKQLNLINKVSSNNSYFKDKIKKFVVPIPRDTKSNLIKLNYINNRLGTNISYSKCSEYKIILNFAEFLRINKILVDTPNEFGYSIKSTVVKTLDRSYLGFLSSNNNKIVFRDTSIDGSGYFGRYYKVTLDVLNRSPNTFYSLMSQFNPLYTNTINIYIAEGTFDILSVYENLYKNDSQNALFFASCGYSFSTILKYLIYTGVNTGINLHIYSDNDKSDSDHRRLLKDRVYDIWLNDIFIHRNTYEGEKDFGVPKDRIIDYSYKLKR